MNLIYYLAAAASGMANPAQAGANAQLRKSTDQAIFSAVIVYGSGLIFMLLAQVIVRQTWPMERSWQACHGGPGPVAF